MPSLVLNKGHVLSDLYYRKCRYKVYWGGRGSAKSWGVAEALIRLTAALPLRVLCCREFQTSIKNSSHKLLKDTITRLGMEAWFTVTENSIRSRSGAEFLFMGLHGNEQGVKSTEGVDICWVEEGQSVSAGSWVTLPATVRNPGSEIWVTYNLIDEADATHMRFVAHPMPEGMAIVHKVNYDSNPYFTDELRMEMERDKAVDYHLYEHIWLGMPLKMSNAVVLAGKYKVMEFDSDRWRGATRPLYGGDFGFADDPSTLIRSFIIETPVPGAQPRRKLYVEYEAYGTGVELNQMGEFYGAVPGSKEWPIKGDAAQPATIQHIRGMGYSISAAEKWDGSVKDGIMALRGFDEIIIHPRCVKTAQEARLWRWKTDPKTVDEHGQPLVLPVLVKGNDHCWDAIRYSLDGYILRSGVLGTWQAIAQADKALPAISSPGNWGRLYS